MQLAPIVDFFMLLIVLIYLAYIGTLNSQAYQRMGKVTVEADAIFQAMFGDILPELEAAQNAAPELTELIRTIRSVRAKAQALNAAVKGGQ